MSRVLPAGTAVLLVLAVLGCSTLGDRSHPASVQLTRSTPLMKAGSDYKVEATLPLEADGKHYLYYGLTEDGLAFGQEHQADAVGELAPRNAVVTDPATGTVTRLSDGSTRPEPTRFTGMAYASGHVVWVETPSDNAESGDWVMYSYDLESSREREIARAPGVPVSDRHPGIPGGTVPRIWGDTVYFNAAEPDKSDHLLGGLFSVPIDGSEPASLLLSGAEGAFVGNGQLYYRAEDLRIRRMDLATGAKSVVKEAVDIKNPCGGFFGEGTLVLCDQPAGEAKVLRIHAEGRKAVTILTGTETVGHITATARWVRFDADGRPVVYDLERGKLMRESEHEILGVSEGPGDLLDLAPIRVDRGEERATQVSFIRLN